ncbi:MAG: hypothetical protein U5L00_20960 [Desulfovermiculus sp.]|nr:hypothetical protein [Desulfovermiculus sp.]
MALAKEDYQAMEEHVREILSSWLAEQERSSFVPMGEIEIRERIVRVEEELKNQRELMKQGFELMEKRFEQVEKRFEQVDKRFEQMDKRFEQMDARFEALTRRMDRFMIWSFGLTVSMAGVVIGVLKFT